jgi:hypothetical protein
LISVLVATVRAAVTWGDRTSQTVAAEADLDRLTDRWYADAATAWAVFTPPNDVFGTSNADGHEFDLVTENSQRQPSFQAYRYDSAGKRLLEYTYGSPGSSPTATGDESDNISAFSAATYPATELQDASSPLYDPLFTGATIANAAVPLNLGSNAIGGNQITRIHFAANRLDRTVLLSSATAPSNFTVILKYTPPP